MADLRMRPYQPDDEAGLLAVWNRSLVADRISPATWRSKVLLDPSFDPELCLVADDGDAIRGFCLAIVRQVPFLGDPLDPARAWITALAVAPEWWRQGIGGRLLGAALDRLRQRGRREVHVSPYVPNYFAPGVDVDAYPDAVAFLERRGFAVVSRPVGMYADLEGYVVPPAVEEAAQVVRREGVVGPATARDILPTLALIRRHFSWDWWREAQEVCHALFAGDPRGVGLIVARQGDRVLGYAQHRGEHFGPFGVDPDCRGQGIGRVLLAETMMGMVQQGYHCAWFLWTGEQAARGVYASCGFRIRRRFAILGKGLSAED